MSKETNAVKAGDTKKSCTTCSCCRHPVCLGVRVVALAAILGGLWYLYQQNNERKREIQQITQEIAHVRHGATRVSLQEIDFLLSLASYDSQLFDSKTRLFSHLTDISHITDRMPKTYALPLQAAVAQDRQRLAEYNPVDVKGIVEKIDAWIALVDPLSGSIKDTVPASATPVNNNDSQPTANTTTAEITVQTSRGSAGIDATATSNTTETTSTTTPNKTPNDNTTTETASSWPEKLQQGWEQLKGIVKIKRGESDENVFVVSTQKWVITEKLKMQLESMKIAALSHDNTLFQRTRTQALNWLDTYYSLSSDDSRIVRDGLMAASTWDVALKPFMFDNLKSAMNNLQQQQDQTPALPAGPATPAAANAG